MPKFLTEGVRSRKNHQYPPTGSEYPTPIQKIPREHRRTVPLPGGRTQVVDDRLCYNWDPAYQGGKMVECSSVASHAAQEGFEDKSVENKKGCLASLPLVAIAIVRQLASHPEIWNS